MKKTAIILAAICLIWILSIASCGMPKGLGVSTEGKLKEVPKSPNCISSQADVDDEKHYMPAWSFEDLESSKVKVLKSINDFGKTEIKTNSEDYIHAVFITGFWRYKDDVEFYFDRDKKLIHFRSASRIGHSDMGVNRERMEKLKLMYLE